MNPDDEAKQHHWQRLYNHALALVRHGFSPPFLPAIQSRSHKKLLRIMYMPSFEDVVGWEVFETLGGDPVFYPSCIAHCTTWKQAFDLDQFETPQDRLSVLRRQFQKDMEPTLMYATAAPDTERVQAAMSRLSALRLPLLLAPSSIAGCDGDFYELTLGDGFAEVMLHWWEEPPAAWNEAGQAVKALLEHLNGLPAQPYSAQG